MSHKFLASVLALAALTGNAVATDYTVGPPTQDRYLYPFAASGATSPTANVFSTNITNFDNRDATFVVRFDTATGGIPSGNAANTYNFTGAKLVLWHVASNSYAWDTRNPQNDQLQVFGMGVSGASSFTKASWTETSPYEGQAGAPGGAERNPHPLNISDSASPQNVTNVLAATPWGLGEPVYGTTAGEYTPGGTPTAPFPVTFTLNVADARVKAYIQDGLATGQVDWVFSTTVTLTGPGGSPPFPYPTFYTKEEADGTGNYAPSFIVEGVPPAAVSDWSVYN